LIAPIKPSINLRSTPTTPGAVPPEARQGRVIGNYAEI
jgi:hypothetical protein